MTQQPDDSFDRMVKAVTGFTPSMVADNQLRLRHANRLMASRNPALRQQLAAQPLVDGRSALANADDWVGGYRAAYSNPQVVHTAAPSVAFLDGAIQGIKDLHGQWLQDTTGAGVIGRTS